MKIKLSIMLLVSTFSLPLLSQDAHRRIIILIHGTHAKDAAWYKPGGDFYEELASLATKQGRVIIPFEWPGNWEHGMRLLAARNLVKLIKQYPADTAITLICHSHGANVGILAARLLGQEEHPPLKMHRIEKMYALGAPVNNKLYAPNMQVIHKLYNLFSLQDYVQPSLGFFERTYHDHERIANVRVIFPRGYPGHSELHGPLMGRWLLAIHEVLAQQAFGGFDLFNFNQPGSIHFFEHQQPHYMYDARQRLLLAWDRGMQKKIFYNKIARD